MFDDDPAAGAVRSAAFDALLNGTAPTREGLARLTGLDTAAVERATARLEDHGALELGADGRIVGAHGLTRRTTVHAIDASDRTLHTWCAFDAIGIPAALDLDADVHTRCPACGARIDVGLRRGSPPAGNRAVLWLPGGPCAHVMNDFCAAANLFCHRDHLEAWRARNGDPPGRTLTLGEVAEEGRRAWSDVASLRTRSR